MHRHHAAQTGGKHSTAQHSTTQLLVCNRFTASHREDQVPHCASIVSMRVKQDEEEVPHLPYALIVGGDLNGSRSNTVHVRDALCCDPPRASSSTHYSSFIKTVILEVGKPFMRMRLTAEPHARVGASPLTAPLAPSALSASGCRCLRLLTSLTFCSLCFKRFRL